VYQVELTIVYDKQRLEGRCEKMTEHDNTRRAEQTAREREREREREGRREGCQLKGLGRVRCGWAMEMVDCASNGLLTASLANAIVQQPAAATRRE